MTMVSSVKPAKTCDTSKAGTEPKLLYLLCISIQARTELL